MSYGSDEYYIGQAYLQSAADRAQRTALDASEKIKGLEISLATLIPLFHALNERLTALENEVRGRQQR